MATFHQGVHGLVRGRIGSVVNTIWRRIGIMRIIPASVSNPRTPAQVAQRTKFALVVQFLRPLLRFVKIGFKGYAVRQTAFNAAMSYHMQHAVVGEFPDQAIDFSLVRVSQGTLPRALSAQATALGERKVSVSWDPKSDFRDVNPNDQAIIVAYNPDKEHVNYWLDAGVRGDEETEVVMPQAYTGDTVHIYLLFGAIADLVHSGTHETISNSVYAGGVIVS